MEGVFPNLLQLITGRPQPDYERRFVLEGAAKPRRARNPRIERFLIIAWALIAIKCVFVWVIRHHLPFNPLFWVIIPTIIFATLATAVYHWR